MNRPKWLYPILILISSILALVTSLGLYIYWYLEVSDVLKTVVQRFEIDKGQVLEPQTWIVIMVLSILVGFILICIFTIFVYNQKTIQLYRLQQNFINNFTHELKTPVTSLKLYLETFLKHELPRKDQLKYIEYMLQDAERLSENVSQILNLGRIESGNYNEEMIAVDLMEVTEDFLHDNKHLFQNCEITVSNPFGYSCVIKVNPSLFEMLLMNLLTNAMKYNNSEVPKIEILFMVRNKKLKIKFRDNGIGIEKKEIKKIFKKFYQVGRSDNRSAKGSGLGLYMSDNIARIFKGRLKAASKGLNEGSEFILTLPYNLMLN
ncbi:HAMP domain-containing histidine kinase [bacterium]|nr:HAMP domain-containing histidine kinase [bacterium]